MTCNCKTYCKTSLYTALRHLRKQCLYYDDDDCKPNIKELDDTDAYRIHDVMEKLSNGYVLVPEEPTEKMLDVAGDMAVAEYLYKSMIEASQEEEL